MAGRQGWHCCSRGRDKGGHDRPVDAKLAAFSGREYAIEFGDSLVRKYVAPLRGIHIGGI